MPNFETSVTLKCDVHVIFDFLIRPENIRSISPPEIGLSFVDPPEAVEHGSRIDFKVQHYGTVQQISHEIILFDRPRQFTEKQVQGPLNHWVHEHVFEATESGEVVVIDRIEFEPPTGLVGLLVNERKIRETLEDGFDHRHDELERLWGG